MEPIRKAEFYRTFKAWLPELIAAAGPCGRLNGIPAGFEALAYPFRRAARDI
jgi:hypothetical protein